MHVSVESKGAGAQRLMAIVTVAAEVLPGTHCLLFDDEFATTLRPFVVSTLPVLMEQEPNDDPKKPQTLLAAQRTVNGRQEMPGAVDCFAVKLLEAQTLGASLLDDCVLVSPMAGLVAGVRRAAPPPCCHSARYRRARLPPGRQRGSLSARQLNQCGHRGSALPRRCRRVGLAGSLGVLRPSADGDVIAWDILAVLAAPAGPAQLVR